MRVSAVNKRRTARMVFSLSNLMFTAVGMACTKVALHEIGATADVKAYWTSHFGRGIEAGTSPQLIVLQFNL